MNGRGLRRYIWLGLVVLPISGTPQLPLSAVQTPGATETAEIGGRTAFDLVRLDFNRISIPLRYGNIRVGSERVELEGRTLRKGEDYSIDYLAGAIYLSVPYREGQSLRVQYRYDDTKVREGSFTAGGGSGFQGLKLNFTPGASMVFGMGLTERLADGTVLSSNVYGLNNAFKLSGGGTLSGMYFVSDRHKAKTSNLMGDSANPSSKVEEGSDTAVVQNYTSDLLGGKLSADYQAIGDDFAGFQAFEGAGYDANAVAAFKKERGIKRSGFNLTGLKLGGLNLSNSFRTVGDASGSINWRDIGLKSGGLALNWSEERVDRSFARANDLREADRAWLGKERGMGRQTFAGSFDRLGGKLGYNAVRVRDDDGSGFSRETFGYEGKAFKFDFFGQKVQREFTRFGDLREDDREQLRREAGLDRMSWGVQSGLVGGLPLKYSTSRVRSDSGDFKAADLSIAGKRWSLENVSRNADPGFGYLGSLGNEIGGHVSAVAKMYDPAANPDGQDVPLWGQGAGIGRDLWRLNYDLGKGYKARVDRLDLRGQGDGGNLNTFVLTGPKYNLRYRDQSLGDGFAEIGRMLASERNVLGSLPGLQRTDLAFDAALDKNRSLSVSTMRAGLAQGDVSRETLAYRDKGIELDYARRNVDSSFHGVNQLADPERDRLVSLIGYNQTDFGAKWQVLPKLSLDLHWVDGQNISTGMDNRMRRTGLNYSLDANTRLSAVRFENKQDQLTSSLADQQYEQFLVDRKLGRFGQVTFVTESQKYDGANDPEPDSKRNTVVYQTNLTAKTALRTEQSEKLYETGERETMSQNTLSAELTKRTGVSLTDTQIKRDRGGEDEVQRNYGFWYDFGKGVRFTYGYARKLIGENVGTLNSNVSLTPGEVQGVKIESASYQHNGWDDQRDQHVGKIGLSTVKPLQLGFLRDVTFGYSSDTARDMDVFQKEDHNATFAGHIGKFGLGFDYRSQYDASGYRGIDRGFRFTTDKSEKSRLRADMLYKVRTLPWNDQVIIRDFSVQAVPLKGLAVTHKLQTNPEQQRSNVILGSLATDLRTTSWRVDFTGNKNLRTGLEWNEAINDRQNTLMRSAKLNLGLFMNSGSPLYLSYGLNQSDTATTRQTANNIELRFDQKPGPNQTFSFYLNSLNWEHSQPNGLKPRSWNLRFEYSLRF